MALYQFHIPILVHGTKIESKEFVYSIKMIQLHFFHSNNLNLIVHTCNKMGSFCRDKIQCIDELLTLGSLKIMKLSQTRANYVNLHNKVSIMGIFMLRKFCIDCWTYVQWFSQWVNGWYVSIRCITAEVNGHCSPDTAYYTVTAVHSRVCGGPRSHLHHPGSPDPGVGRGT